MKIFYFFVFAVVFFAFPCLVSGVPPKDSFSKGFDPDVPNYESSFVLEYKNTENKNLSGLSIEYPPYGSDDWERAASGNQSVLVIPVMFSDVKNKTTVDDLKKIMGNLSEYYCINSNGRLNLTYDISDWVMLNKTMSYYGADGGFENKSNLRIDALNTPYYQIASDAVKSVDSYVDFSKYDHLIIVHAGEDQAGSPKCGDCIWSTAFPYVGVETNDNCITYSNGVFCDNVDYAILLSETDPFGVYAHEFGHDLGLPDLYDTNSGSSVVGVYDVMDGGEWINSNFGAFSKLKLKFADAVIVYNETRNLTVYPSADNNTVVKVIRGNQDSWQYYLVELRKKEGFDSMLPAEGVLVWKIDESFASNQKSRHKPIADLFLFNESVNFADEEGGVFINITLNTEKAELSVFSLPNDLNITNRVLAEEYIKPETCKNLDIYTGWPENNPQYFVFPANETDYFTVNDDKAIIWAKVNANIGENITFAFINNSDSYQNITFTRTKNMSRNTYNSWNWYIDPFYTSLKLSASMAGNWSVKLLVNGIFYYANNFTVSDKIDTKPPSVYLFTTKAKDGNILLEWNASDEGINSSGLKNYVIKYYDNDSAFFSGEMRSYTTDKTNAVFYGSRWHTYCFSVEAFDRSGNHNISEFKCESIKPCVNLTGTEVLNENTILCGGFYSNVSVIINSSDIFLECSNSSLRGTGTGYGVYNQGFENVTIKNCKISNYSYGIYINNSNSCEILNNEISNNSVGIHSENSTSTINSNFVCNNPESDFNSSDWLSSSGDNNTCDNPDGWNDNRTAISGCAVKCTIRPGDSDGDGAVNIFDVLWAEKIAVGLPGPPVGNADADCDGGVNIFDVLWIEKIAVGLPGKC